MHDPLSRESWTNSGYWSRLCPIITVDKLDIIMDTDELSPTASACITGRSPIVANDRAAGAIAEPGPRAGWTSRIVLGVVYAVSAFSLAGFATFGRHPERLAASPQAAAAYGWILLYAPRVQILVAFLALALVLVRRVQGRWLAAFVAVYALSLASELSGTTIGLPFGPYQYTPALGTKWFGHVPLLIPLSWFFMALPSYALASRRFAGKTQLMPRVLAGSLLLLSWDLSLDPAMSLVTSFWVWGTTGPYYGMPLLNLAGWYVTGLVLMLALAWLRTDEWVSRVPVPWLVGFYGANLVLPLGMSVVAGLWGAVIATGVALVACWLITRTSAPGVPAFGALDDAR
jgi:putative membrane protein